MSSNLLCEVAGCSYLLSEDGSCLGCAQRAAEGVNHPQHYGGDTTYEAIKVIEAWALGFSLGNAVKYIARAGKKNPAKELEDLKKAEWYLGRRINQLEKGRTE